MGGALEHVAFDIETTGLAATDAVTVVGFEVELGCLVCYQTDGRDAGAVEEAVRERTDATVTVAVSGYESEAALLEAVSGIVAERFRSADVLLVGYNGETWDGGFDLPFLRTRYGACDVPWPFRGVPYADLLPVIRDLFNTRSDGSEPAGLDAAYDVLCEGAAGACDPFAESADAVTAFETGAFADVVVHNVADLRRTGALSRLAQRYCSKSDFDVKSLTATVDD